MTQHSEVEGLIEEFQSQYMEVWARGVEPVLHVTDYLRTAFHHQLQKARQAGIDEAVEALEKAKIKANKEVTREYSEGVYEGLCHAVHLVKALQDNK